MARILTMTRPKRRPASTESADDELFREIQLRLATFEEIGDDADKFGDRLVATLQNEIARRRRLGLTPEKFGSTEGS